MKSRLKLLKPGNIVVSPSQLDTAESCLRKWWFERIIKLPTIQKDYLTFGTLFHSVVERWLAADRVGRVPSPFNGRPDCVWQDGPLKGQKLGDPVDLFPEGWTELEERGRTYKINSQEAALIKRLVTESIEDGVIQRYEGREMERAVQLPVIEGAELWGFIDVEVPEGIHDHKTYGPGGKRYLKRDGPKDDGRPIPITTPYEKGDGTSPNCVGHDRKMLTYAWDHLLRNGNDPVLVRHNQIPRFHDESVRPKSVEAWVSADRLAQHWAHVQEVTSSMVPLAAEKNPQRWRDIPGPRDSFEQDLNACAKYGGCAFRTICARTESPTTYKTRVDRVLARTAGQSAASTTTDRGTQMDIFKRDAARRASNAASKDKAAGGLNGGTEVEAPVEEQQEAATATATLEVAPWADSSCGSCGGTGQNIKKGRPCMLCASTAKQRGVPEQAWFEIEAAADGSLTWTIRPKFVDKYEAFLDGADAAPEQPQNEETQTDADTSTDDSPAPADAGAAEAKPEKQDEAPEAGTGRGGRRKGSGRPKIGVQLRLGITVVKGPNRKHMTIQDLLLRYGSQLAEANGVDNYFALDAFMRRDRLAQMAAQIVEDLGTVIITGRVSCPDTRALYSALVAVCEDVKEGSDIG